jgi:hypothetical protein
MDYTRGALDVPRAALVSALVRHLGNPQEEREPEALEALCARKPAAPACQHLGGPR